MIIDLVNANRDMRMVVVAQLTCLLTTFAVGMKEPTVSLCSLLTFFGLTACFFFVVACNSYPARRRIVNFITSASSFAVVLLVVAALVRLH